MVALTYFSSLSGDPPNVLALPSMNPPSSWASSSAAFLFFSDETTPDTAYALSASWWSSCPDEKLSPRLPTSPAAKLSK